jgi:hypothetical protein
VRWGIQDESEESNVIGAVHESGIATRNGMKLVQEGKTRDPSDPLKIMSKNPHFSKFSRVETEQLMVGVKPQISVKIGLRGFALEGKLS